MTAVLLSGINADRRLQPRVTTEGAVSERYAQAMLRGDTLPYTGATKPWKPTAISNRAVLIG
jgi:hypothetical protein